MAPIYKIAVIQLHPKVGMQSLNIYLNGSPNPLILTPNPIQQPLDPEANFQKASAFIVSAASQGAHLAVLPEYHLTNWLPKDPRFAGQCAQWSLYLSGYQSLAAQHNICIIPGTIVELHHDLESGQERLLNKAYFIDDHGKILSSYTKKNLWHPEREHLTGSAHDPHDAFDTPLGKVGMLICWDLAFPEAFRELIAKGAKILVVPTLWTLSDCNEYGLRMNPKSEEVLLESMITARAFENTCCVIFANAGAPAGSVDKGTYVGLSRVALPFVGAKGEETKGSREEGMSIVDVDMEILEQAEANYGVRGDLAREGWHYTYRHERKGRL